MSSRGPSTDLPPLIGSAGINDVAEADWSEAEESHISAPPEVEPESTIELESDSSKRRRMFIWGSLIVLFIIIIALATGGSKKTQTSIQPAIPQTPATPTKPTTTPAKGFRVPTGPTESQLGLPTAAEVAAAKNALTLAEDDIYADQRNFDLVATGEALHQELLARYNYSISVIESGTPRPFLGNQAGVDAPQRGQLSITFANQAGYILLETTAGNIGEPYVMNVHLLPQTRLIIPADSMFASGSSTLLPQGQQFVQEAAKQLATAITITCTGYTDSQGGVSYNYRLGLARATTVCDQLKASGTTARLYIASGGLTHPRATNSTPQGRALNRRVELDATYTNGS